MARRTSSRSSGWVRSITRSTVDFVVGSNSNIRYVSSDQKISPVRTFQPKLPVWLNRCASAR